MSLIGRRARSKTIASTMALGQARHLNLRGSLAFTGYKDVGSYCGHDRCYPRSGPFSDETARGGFNEANSSRRLRDGLGSYRNGHHSSGENAVGTDCEGWGTSTRRRFADAAAYGRASRQGESAHWQGQRAGRDQVLKGLGSTFSHRPRGAEAAPRRRITSSAVASGRHCHAVGEGERRFGWNDATGCD